MRKTPPRLLIVETVSFDYLAQFSLDPQLANLFRQYEPVSTVGPFRFFRHPAAKGIANE
jgi:hypothetical protein